MGSRGNVFITSTMNDEYKAANGEQIGIYLYSHWDGHELPALVQSALAHGRDRWSDEQYLARILVDRITAPAHGQNTGFGLGLAIRDNSFPITVVDLGAQTVSFARAGGERSPSNWTDTRSFADYVKGKAASYPSGVAG